MKAQDKSTKKIHASSFTFRKSSISAWMNPNTIKLPLKTPSISSLGDNEYVIKKLLPINSPIIAKAMSFLIDIFLAGQSLLSLRRYNFPRQYCCLTCVSLYLCWQSKNQGIFPFAEPGPTFALISASDSRCPFS